MSDELEKLFDKLPVFISDTLLKYSYIDQLTEIILDLGRRPEARFFTGPKYISQKVISWQDLEYISKRISKFSTENRAGIERTLHRISCIRNRQFLIIGLTCRIGRSVFGTISVIRDLLESGQSILLLGKPGIGKTTIIREIGRVLADEMEKRVIIIDTSNEIAGESDIPHLSIGRARRMQVAKTELQHQIMIEAVENHMPQVVIVDEISTTLEVLAARTISEKGLQLVGTTHGNCLQNLIKNPSLTDLIGGIHYVTLSDDEARRRKTQKTVLERKAYPAFKILIEINHQNQWTIHEDIKISIDLLLRGDNFIQQIRIFSLPEIIKIVSKQIYSQNGTLAIKQNFLPNQSWHYLNKCKSNSKLILKSNVLIIYTYSISSNLIKEVLLRMGINFVLTNEIKDASIIIGLRKYITKNTNIIKIANIYRIPVYSLHSMSYYKLIRLFKIICNVELT